MKKVLLVSLAFPPLPVVGVSRVAKFCKYLPEMGFTPFALTEKIRKETQKDWHTLEDMGDGVHIVRTINFQPFYWWDYRGQDPLKQATPKPTGQSEKKEIVDTASNSGFNLKRKISNALRFTRKVLTVPDARLSWIPQGVIPGFRLIQREKIDIIFSSSPHPTNHLMAHLLSKLTGRPHVMDYRDLWTLNGSYFMRNIPDFLKRFDTSIEKRILKHCKGIVVATNTFKNKLLKGFEELNLENKITVIFNGIDEADYSDDSISKPQNSKFQISYFGNLYGFRNPVEFIKAVARWIEKNPDVKDKIRVDFWGACDPAYLSDISKFHLENIISINTRISQKEAINKMFETDLLLLIQGVDPRISDSIPTKLFEYIAIGKPMLAFFPPGEAADIILEDAKHLVVTEPDTDKIVEYLQDQFDLYKNDEHIVNTKVQINPKFIRKNQTEQLANFFDNILE